MSASVAASAGRTRETSMAPEWSLITPSSAGGAAYRVRVEHADLAPAGLDPAERAHRLQRAADRLDRGAGPPRQLLLAQGQRDLQRAVVLLAEALAQLEHARRDALERPARRVLDALGVGVAQPPAELAQQRERGG